ncbi:ABC transporter substrate-binding protein [Paraburkholderia aspalathi]|nr:ABC transporter substrate-binding protein [Paraburkholderia aspalathi]
MTRRTMFKAILAVGLLAASLQASSAEVTNVRLARQFGVGYLPLIIVQEQGLLEKHAKEKGLEITTEWLRFTGGSGMNEALLSGNLDFAAGGVGPMLTIWARTVSNMKIKGVAALASMPLHLITTNPSVKTLADFTATDKIALPTVKTSIQAITLQMAAAQAFGEGKQGALDSFTVSMGHPDAQLSLLGGRSEVTAHFGSPPFQNQEATDPRAHKVLDSYDVLGGPHTFTVVWASAAFIEGNPKVTEAFMAALNESIALITNDPEQAADLWMAAENTSLTRDEAIALIKDKQTRWTTSPERLLPYINFMAEVGLVKQNTDNERDLFFNTID